MRRFTKKLWAALLLLLVSMQSMATDVFTSNRTDFRDESIYFMITTRFYDGDPKNNVLCWDNHQRRLKQKTLAGEATSRVLSTSSTTSRRLVSLPSGLLLSYRTHLVMTTTAIMLWISSMLTAAIRAVMVRAVT